jgi:hypothetical protein
MKKIFSSIILGIFLISLISAFPICVDKTPPSAPSNLILTKVGNGIQLTWNPATDVPACSGISHYDIYRGFNGGSLSLVGNSSTTSFLDNITPQVGTYTYIVHAWDLVGHNEGNGVSKSINIEASGGTTPSGGGGGGGGVSNIYSCGDWEDCINGIQERICTSGNLQTTETRNCLTTPIPTPSENETQPTQTTTGFLGLTGAAIGSFVKSGEGIVTLTGLITIVVATIAFFSIRKNKLAKSKNIEIKKE